MKTVDGKRPVIKNKKYAPATGIQSDFEKVLTTFVNTKSVRYEEFVKIWRENKLSLIWAGRQNDREVVEFMEECMKIAFKMFQPPYGFQARVGALYLLYGLYWTQPCLPKVKIRVTQRDWVEIKKMREDFIKQNHHDTLFILEKLLADGSFWFCATSEEPKSSRCYQEDSSVTTAEGLREERQSIDNLFSEESLEQLHMVHVRYDHLKTRLSGVEASRPERSLDVLQDRFPVSITDQIQKHHERWRLKESFRHGRHFRYLPTVEEQGFSDDKSSRNVESADVGQRRVQLKALAFMGHKNKQRYKHRVLATEPTPDKSPKKRGRPTIVSGGGHTSIKRAKRGTGRPKATDSGQARLVEPESSSGLLHMPQLAEPEVGAPKSKVGKTSKHKSTTKQDDMSSPGPTACNSVVAAAHLPRKRGRPPKNSVTKTAEESSEKSNKLVKSRVIPLKIKDSGKRKYIRKRRLSQETAALKADP